MAKHYHIYTVPAGMREQIPGSIETVVERNVDAEFVRGFMVIGMKQWKNPPMTAIKESCQSCRWLPSIQ